METITLEPGQEYEVVIADHDPKAPGKVYAGEFHHIDGYAVTLIVRDPSARQNVIDLVLDTKPGEDEPRIHRSTDRNGYRQFTIPLGRVGEIREPGKKGVRTKVAPAIESAAE
jgi:hypothetical protein